MKGSVPLVGGVYLGAARFDGKKALTASMLEQIMLKYYYPRNKTAPNIYLGEWECDVLSVTPAGMSHEFEVKLTAADFRQDAKKVDRYGRTKYSHIQAGERTNRFSYVIPAKILDKIEVPEWAGILVAQVEIKKYGDEIYDRIGRDNPRYGMVYIDIKLYEHRASSILHRDTTKSAGYIQTIYTSVWHRAMQRSHSLHVFDHAHELHDDGSGI